MRNTEELLELLLESIENCSPLFFTGMCHSIQVLYLSNRISGKENDFLEDYLKDNCPRDIGMEDYWWDSGLKKPRINWVMNELLNIR